MRTRNPLYLALAALLCILVAILVSPLIPHPLGTIVFWLAWIGSVLLFVLTVAELVRRSGP